MANVNITVSRCLKTVNKAQIAFVFTFNPKSVFFRLVERLIYTLIRSVFWNWFDSVFVFGKVKLIILYIINAFPFRRKEGSSLNGLAIFIRLYNLYLFTYFHCLYYLFR